MPEVNAGSLVLVVEDNDDDFEATERALRQADDLQPEVRRCRDGLQAWQVLNRTSEPNPSLILLDLNMPGLDGRNLLKRLKENENLCHIPVVVMTTSDAEEDVVGCYRSGANSFVQKPLDWKSFVQTIRGLREYWFELSKLPG